MIYLASPYSHDDPAVRAERYYVARDEAARLLALGCQVYSPIAYGHHLEICGQFSQPADWWQEFDDAILRAASEAWVLMLEGWTTSAGISHEIELAHECDIPTRYIMPGEITETA